MEILGGYFMVRSWKKSKNEPKKALDYYYRVLEEFPTSLLCEPVRFHVRKLNEKLKS
jgi:hypothetical protein